MTRPDIRITRRALASSAAVAPLVLAAGRRSAGAQLEPWQAGDPLRLAGSPAGLGSLDPALSRELSANFILRQVFRGLVALDDTLVPRPELAESVDVSSDGLRHAVTLRDNARFHDGRSITPEDVRTSFSRALDPELAGGIAEGLAALVYLGDIAGADAVLSGAASVLSGVEVTGDRTLDITLAQRSPTFLMRLAAVPASIVDAGQVGESGWDAMPNGSGPFAVHSFRPLSGIELRPADTWWDGRPQVEAVSVRLGPTASQPLNLYQAGEIDLAPDLAADLIGLVEDPASGITYGSLERTPQLATGYIALGNQAPPFDDPHVRRALQLVFPGELVAAASYNGAVLPAAGILPPGMLGREWPVQRPQAGVEAARAELARSRYGTAGRVPPLPIYGGDIEAVEALREVAGEALGLEIDAIQVGWGDFLAGLAGRQFPAYHLFWGADYPDPEAMIDMLFAAGSGDNYTAYANAELDALLDEARDANGDTRIGLYERANQLLVDDAAVIPLYHWMDYTIVREGIAGVEVTPMGILGLESIHAR